MKKLIFGAVLVLMGWIGLVGIICSSASTLFGDFAGFLKAFNLHFLFLCCWMLLFVGGWICIYETYLFPLTEKLKHEKTLNSENHA